MTGLDFFSTIYRSGVDLPIRIFMDGIHANFYRPHALSFCDLALEDEEEIPSDMSLLEGFDVSIIADELGDKVRELTKAVIAGRPRHLAVCCGEKLMSWSGHRGWK